MPAGAKRSRVSGGVIKGVCSAVLPERICWASTSRRMCEARGRWTVGAGVAEGEIVMSASVVARHVCPHSKLPHTT